MGGFGDKEKTFIDLCILLLKVIIYKKQYHVYVKQAQDSIKELMKLKTHIL